jgi:sulfite exporter TauE/SafE
MAYHLGRLLGYSVLGGIAGLLGSSLLTSRLEGTLSWIAALTVGISLIMIGLKSWKGGGVHLFQLPSPALSFLYRHAGQNSFLVGALSAFLPCGWLQSFVLAAVSTRHVTSGALLLFFFWLGTLPALTVAPMLAQKFLAPLARRLPRLSALLLISAGLLSIGVKASTIMRHSDNAHQSSTTPSCHHSKSIPLEN